MDDGIVAWRRFERDDGTVDLLLHRPEPWPSETSDRDPDWRCRYTITFPDGQVVSRQPAGVDPMQALLLALEAAWVDLRFVGDGTPAQRPPIQWLDQVDLGLSIRDLDAALEA